MKLKKIGKKLIPLLTVAFTVLVLYFLYQVFSKIEWVKVAQSMKEISMGTLAISLVLVFLNYLILSNYDYIGFRYFKIPKINYLKASITAMISYAFNFNLGALIGGLGFRIRMYSGWGVAKKSTTLVALLSVGTTWLGFVILGSILILFGENWMPGPVREQASTLKFLAACGLSVVGVYFYLCLRRKVITIKQKATLMPPIRYAFLQSFLALCQWNIAASVAYLFLIEMNVDISYAHTLFTFLAASLGGVIARIPSGMGVLEAIFLKLNQGLPSSSVLAAIICFRITYYIIPLAAAIPSYLILEIYQKKLQNK